jgi:hypothetical protein
MIVGWVHALIIWYGALQSNVTIFNAHVSAFHTMQLIHQYNHSWVIDFQRPCLHSTKIRPFKARASSNHYPNKKARTRWRDRAVDINKKSEKSTQWNLLLATRSSLRTSSVISPRGRPRRPRCRPHSHRRPLYLSSKLEIENEIH